MRIALLNPTYLPEAAGGNERLTRELALRLQARGHEVSVLTSHRGAPRSSSEGGVKVLRSFRPGRFRPLRWYEDHLDSLPGVVARLWSGGYDLAHAFSVSYGWGAVKAYRSFGAPPVVFTCPGVPTREYLVARRYRIEMLRSVATGAAATTVPSAAAAAAFRSYLRVTPQILGGGVDPEAFASAPKRAAEPTIIAPINLGAPGNGTGPLFAAFGQVRERIPAARLRLIGSRDRRAGPAPMALPEGADWIDAANADPLGLLLGSGWVSVGAGGEGIGLELIESLAAGTPVLVSDPAENEPLDQRLLAALGSPPSAAEVDACRARAAEFDWRRIVVDYEALYEGALSASTAR